MNTPVSSRESLAPLDALDARIDGHVTFPGQPGWDEARTAWNLAVDQRPVAVVVAGSVGDIVEAVRTAADLGLSVAAQATGHNAGPLAASDGLADTLLLRTSELRAVQVDPDLLVARVEPGALWGDVVAAVAPHGLAALAGSSHDVGVLGYTLGGGVSWFGRSHGLAANSVVAVELVTADGVRRRIDADHDPELFWAVRGGGGDFGVVTALEFRVYPVAEIFAGTLFFPLERAEEVLQAWAAWSAAVPETVTSVGRVLRFPEMPELPPFLSGQSFAVVEAAIQESPERAEELLAPLRALGPSIDSFHPQPVAELLQLHMDPPAPIPGNGDGMLLTELPADAVRAFIAAVGPDSGSTLLSAEIRHVGGALAPRGRARDGRRARHARTGRHRRIRRRVPRVRRGHRDARRGGRPRGIPRPAALPRGAVARRAGLPQLRRARATRRAALRRPGPPPPHAEGRDRSRRRHPLEPPDASLRGVSLAPSPS